MFAVGPEQVVVGGVDTQMRSRTELPLKRLDDVELLQWQPMGPIPAKPFTSNVPLPKLAPHPADPSADNGSTDWLVLYHYY